MKKYIPFIYLFVFTLLFNLASFAQDPGDFDDNPDADPLDAPVATPIDDYLWVLALAGLVFVFLWFKNHTKQANAQPNEK
jgi:hypothetical protein